MKFAELNQKQKVQYFQEIQEGKRLPSENIHMNSVVIIPEGVKTKEFIQDQDIESNFLNRRVIILPSNGRGILDEG